jgi:uncharacterized damage-inducible protein DinB
MYRTIDDFKRQWDQETESTLKLLSQLTDVSLRQKVMPEGRSLGVIAWHLVTTLGEMMHRAGLLTENRLENAPVPQQAKKIHQDYQTESRIINDAVSLKWKDADLLLEIEMYGEQWKKGMVLMSLILHQAHHRGQLTVLMRQAGLTIPGVYGPSKEEWVQYGMPPQE